MRTLTIFLTAFVAACGITIDDSAPLIFVAPLEGDWALESDATTELRFRIPGGQPLYTGQFTFDVDEVTGSGTTSYVGSVDERDVTIRDATTDAVVYTGTLTLNTLLALSDGRIFRKDFDPNWTAGQWHDVNAAGRVYNLEIELSNGEARGCSRIEGQAEEDELEGTLDVEFAGDTISVFRVTTEGGIISMRAPGFFVGASAIRIKRIDGFLHLQRRDTLGACPTPP